MKERIIKSTVVILLVAILTFSNWAVILSYALDIINETNQENVQFTAYFKDENGNKVTEKTEEITKAEMKLYVEVSVKKQGYFNGSIEITDSNFKLKDQEYGTEVQKVDDNKIILNQINAGNTVVLELDIEPIKDKKYNVDNLDKISLIKINGIYRDSDEVDKEVKDTRKVNLKFINPYSDEETNPYLTINTITNKIYQIEENEIIVNKKIIQYEIISGFNENLYPIKSTFLKLVIPENVESYEVLERGLFATGGTLKHNKTENELNITIENTPNDENEIYWDNFGKDTIIVTFVLDENAVIEENNINQEIKLYDDTIYKNQAISIVNDEKDGIVDYEIVAENEIYKGKLNEGITKEIKTISKIDIRYENITNNITITEGTTNYKIDGELQGKIANLNYKNSLVNKEQLLKVLGNEGILTIKDINGNVLTVINSETATNEDGNIIINYAENIKEIVIEIQNAKNTGIIQIEHTREITETTYTKEELRAFSKMEFEGKISSDRNIDNKAVTKSILLKETITKANIQMSQTNLSTTQTNENVEILAILKSDSEQYDLYKNPTVQIELPSEISKINIKGVKVFDKDGFNGNSELTKNENGNFVLNVNLIGEQSNYANIAEEGIVIKIKADIDAKLDTPSKKTTIRMKYTNENGIEEIYETVVDVNLESQYGLLTYTKIYGFNDKNEIVEDINENIVTGILDVTGVARISNMQYKLINNYDISLKNVEIIGKLAQENEDNNTFTTKLESLNTGKSGIKIYYTKDSILSENISWEDKVENLSDVKGYKIVIDEIAPEEVVDINVNIILPEEILYSENAVISNTVNYKYQEQEKTKVQEVKFLTEQKKMNLENGEIVEIKNQIIVENDGIEVAMAVKTQGIVLENYSDIVEKDLSKDESVKEGQKITYYATIKNNTGTDINNLKIVSSHENAEIYGIVDKIDEIGMEYTKYEKVGNTSEVATIEKILNGEEKTISWYAIVDDDVEENVVTFATLNITAENMQEMKIETQKNKIEQAELSVQVEYLMNEESPVYSDSNLRANIILKNISDSDIENVKLKINTLNLEDLKEKGFYANEYTSLIIDEVNENEVTVTIPKIIVGETVEIYFTPAVSDFDIEQEKQIIKVMAEVELDDKTYISNVLSKYAYQNETYFETVLTADPDTTKKITDGEKITFTMETTNKSLYVQGVTYASFELDKGFVIDKVTIVKKGEEIDKTVNVPENSYIEQLMLEKQETEKIILETHVDFNEFATEEITAKFVLDGKEVIKTYSIDTKDVSDKDENYNPSDDDNNGNTDTEGKKYFIEGTAWIDENRNGIREEQEKLLSGITVYALNTNNNIYVASTKTKDDGTYKFELENGNYVIVFAYDSAKYILAEIDGSNVISKNVIIENKEVVAAITKEIELSSNKFNIDLGLIEKKVFDLELNKYINRIIVQNSQGTKTYEYDNTTNAKVEINSKYLTGSTVIIEYGIKVKNTGELSGYVYSIVDYLPEGLEFSSELNKNWYKADGNLYNTSMQDMRLEPGEEKEIILTLTKKMTTNNVGLVNNTAEIYISQNDLGIEDVDSISGNKVNSEDDFGSADVFIAISTGEIQAYIISGIITIGCVLIAIGIFFIRKRSIKERR